MRIGFTADFLTIERISLIVIALICYILGIFLLIFSEAGAVLLLAFFLLSGIFIVKPRIMIYVIIFSFPFLALFAKSTALDLGGGGYLSVNIGGILGITGLIIGTIVLIIRKVNIFKYSLTVPIILFLGTYLISVFTSPLGLYLLSLRYWVRFAMPAVIYYLIQEEFKDVKKAENLLKLSLLFFLPSIITGLWQMLLGVSKFSESLSGDVTLHRVEGTSYLANSYAVMLLIFLLVTYFFIFDPKTRHKWSYIALFFSMIMLIFATYSRIIWGALLVSLTILGVLRNRFLYVVFILAGISILVASPPIRERIMLRIQPDSSAILRIALIKIGYTMFEKEPVLGNGPGTFPLLFKAPMEAFRTKRVNKKYGFRQIMGSHNDYMRTLVEGGIVNFLAYIFLIYKSFKLSFQVLKLPYINTKNYGLLLITFLVSMLIYGATDQGFEFISIYFFFFLAVGEIYLRTLQPQHQLSGIKAVT